MKLDIMISEKAKSGETFYQKINLSVEAIFLDSQPEKILMRYVKSMKDKLQRDILKSYE